MRSDRLEGRWAGTSVLFGLDGVGPGFKLSRHVYEGRVGAFVVDPLAHLAVKAGFLFQNTGGVSHSPNCSCPVLVRASL